MSDKTPLAKLLEVASGAFSLAAELGRAFADVGTSRKVFADPSIWKRLEPAFEKLYAMLVSLSREIEDPEVDFRPVADVLRDAAKIVRRIKKQVKPPEDTERAWEGEPLGRALGVENPGRPQFTEFLEFAPQLLAVAKAGSKAVEEVTHAVGLDDPLSFVDRAPKPGEQKSKLTLLGRYPATDLGHVRFLEWVNIEVTDQARFLAEGRYTHECIERQLKRGVKWQEAEERIKLIRCKTPGVVEKVARILKRELSIGTVNDIADKLGPALRSLRKAVEDYEDNDSIPLPAKDEWLAALEKVKGELEVWDTSHSPSVTNYTVEQIPEGHPLHVAVSELQQFYGGALPQPAIAHWRELLRRARAEDEGADKDAEKLLSWIKAEIQARRDSAPASELLELDEAMEAVMWPDAADESLTAGFRGKSHDALLQKLRKVLSDSLPGNPRITIIQSLQDRGCDLVIEWPRRAKYGIQLKSNRDVEDKEFSTKTIAQIQSSREHGVRTLFVVLAADITNNSNLQKIRCFQATVSSMNDPYVTVVPPEQAWNLLS